jgi:hypothetical protein
MFVVDAEGTSSYSEGNMRTLEVDSRSGQPSPTQNLERDAKIL